MKVTTLLTAITTGKQPAYILLRTAGSYQPKCPILQFFHFSIKLHYSILTWEFHAENSQMHTWELSSV